MNSSNVSFFLRTAHANLRQMGFEEQEVLDALWVHSNNEVAAVRIAGAFDFAL